MIRVIYNFTLILIYCPLILIAQPSTGQEILKREKIYTLSANEQVAHDENSLELYQDELGYIMVTANTKELSRTYHINGKKYGPFNRSELEKPPFTFSSWGFIDSYDDSSYVILNGKYVGRHKDPMYPVGLKIAGDSYMYVVLDRSEGTYSIIINGKKISPIQLHSYNLNSDGKKWEIAYLGSEPNQYFIKFSGDGKDLGPFREIIDFQFLDGTGNRWVLLVVPEDQPTKNINGKEIPQFKVITHKGEIGLFEKEWIGHPEYLEKLNTKAKDKKLLQTSGENYGLNVILDQNLFYLANGTKYGNYKNMVDGVSMGKKHGQFYYIVDENKELRFRGDGLYAKNVDKFKVSLSRRTVAVMKKAGRYKDSLYINDRVFKGVYNEIRELKFSPKGEEWALTAFNHNDNSYTVHFSNKAEPYGPFKANTNTGKPILLLGKDAKNWALSYKDAGTNETKLIVNGTERNAQFYGNIAIIEDDNKEYFSWFSLEEDDKTLYLNKLLLPQD